MRAIIFAFLFGLLVYGCVQAPPDGGGNDTVIPPANNTGAANNTTAIPPDYLARDYCRIDDDCVRLNKCCDCGLGEYVNIYHQESPQCEGPQCACAIAESRGKCVDGTCTAVPHADVNGISADEGIVIAFSKGACGHERMPRKSETPEGMVITGSISTPNPCYRAAGEVRKESEAWRIYLSAEPDMGGNAQCMECAGAINWSANISGYYDLVEVYYEGRMVFPDLESFCGTSTGGACSADMDCIRGGCSAQVCQSRFEEQIITTCEWRDCYDAHDYGVLCACEEGACSWQ